MATANKKNSWVKTFIDKHTPVGVYKEYKGYKKDKAARDSSIIEAAQMQYKKKYGERMSPSYLKTNMESGWLDKKSKDYLKIKKKIRKEVT